MPSKYTKKPKGRKRVSRKPSVALVKTIQAVVKRDVEIKEAYHAQALVSQNPDILLNSDLLRLIPNIGPGVDSNNRIGVKLKAMTLTIRGHMILSTIAANNATSRVAVRLMILQPKLSSTYSVINNPTIAANYCLNLIQKGGASVPFYGALSDLYAPVDKQNSSVLYDKTFYLNVPIMVTNVGQYDFDKTVKFFTIKKKLNKIFNYVDGLDPLQPQNSYPVMVLGYSTLDGTAPVPAQTAVSICYDTTLTYQDA